MSSPPSACSNESVRLRRVLLIATLAVAGIGLIAVAVPLRDWQSIDLRNYLTASGMILRGENPYGRVEYFAPPWMAVLLAPLLALPRNVAGLSWALIGAAAVGGNAALAIRWIGSPGSLRMRALLVAAVTLTPAALFTYVTGQVSALVALAVVWTADQLRRGRLGHGRALLCILFVTLKPHVVALPTAICVPELVRRRAWRTLAWLALGLAAVTLAALAVLPGWPLELLAAWQRGDFRGGRPGLVSPGYLGLAELGLGPWLFVPLALYALYGWWKHGVTSASISLALAAGLLLTPYSRGYDYVVLILPVLLLILEPAERRRALSFVAGAFGALLPLTDLSQLTPVVVVLGLLSRAESQ